MKAVLADTSFYLALLNPQDAAHEAAKRIAKGFRRSVVVTEFVLLEVGNALSPAPVGRDLYLGLVDGLEGDPKVMIVPASTDRFHDGVALYRRRRDKRWSVTDCISFIIMDQMGLAEALTADRHFEQAGFTTLLK
jgi:predicted nucleic acid-binding protein